ncbi:MAG: NUDIX domain-containing protein [Candidatus Thiodiazotropha sp.]|nr:NUDIX domain-containing protein [Candidatus Thiodiazotropha taylori]PUB72482.1 MAG: NUDIX hydrolase [gamma proteobacterium symbiont of Ctena orbiculata]
MKAFNYCPQCGYEGLDWSEDKRLTCHHCGFTYFHNMAAAVGAVLLHGDEILLTVRKHDPARDMLDLPGGFVDRHESLEQALTRELTEELKVVVGESEWRYLFSFPNRYPYAGISYYTSDVFFLKKMETRPEIVVGDDVADAVWVSIADVELESVGLDSVRSALCELKKINIPGIIV